MTRSSKSAHPELSRAMLWFSVAAMALSLPLMVNLVGRMRAEAEMRAAVQQLTAQVDENKLKLVQLQDALDYAKSSAYTERWARVQAHWAMPGEVVVISPATNNLSEVPPRLWWEAFLNQ